MNETLLQDLITGVSKYIRYLLSYGNEKPDRSVYLTSQVFREAINKTWIHLNSVEGDPPNNYSAMVHVWRSFASILFHKTRKFLRDLEKTGKGIGQLLLYASP